MTLNKVLDSISNRMSYLFDRWQDEKEYEDWNDYIKEIKKVAESVEGMQLITVLNQTEFGFIGYYNGNNIKVYCSDVGGDIGLRITLETI
jgi:predicted esterase